MATHEEMQALLNCKTESARRQLINQFASREIAPAAFTCRYCGTPGKRCKRGQRFCSTRCRVTSYRKRIMA
jgi:hypothetical protein